MKKLLVIDDDENFLKDIKELFSVNNIENFRLDTCKDGITALNILSTKDYDMVLLDIDMPVMDGYQVAEEIVKRKVPTRIIMISQVFIDNETAKKSIKSGACDFIIKDSLIQDFRSFVFTIRKHILLEPRIDQRKLDEIERMVDLQTENETLKLELLNCKKALNWRDLAFKTLYIAIAIMAIAVTSYLDIELVTLGVISLLICIVALLIIPTDKIKTIKTKINGVLNSEISTKNK